MRNRHFLFLSLVGLALLLGGCAPTDPAGAAQLQQSENALQQKQYDQAISMADQSLASGASGDEAARALYVRAKSIYLRTKPTPAQKDADIAAATSDDQKALGLATSPALSALIRSDLANMAFFQDDYATAEQYWKQSYDHIDDADSRAWILYRIGLCRQRLDRFAEADATFSDVESNFPNTEPAQRAREHAGMRGFYVQVGPFTDPLAAKKAGDGLRAMGIASKPQMAGSAQVVMAGPRNTYREAQQLRERLITSYPTAVIVP